MLLSIELMLQMLSQFLEHALHDEQWLQNVIIY